MLAYMTKDTTKVETHRRCGSWFAVLVNTAQRSGRGGYESCEKPTPTGVRIAMSFLLSLAAYLVQIMTKVHNKKRTATKGVGRGLNVLVNTASCGRGVVCRRHGIARRPPLLRRPLFVVYPSGLRQYMTKDTTKVETHQRCGSWFAALVNTASRGRGVVCRRHGIARRPLILRRPLFVYPSGLRQSSGLG